MVTPVERAPTLGEEEEEGLPPPEPFHKPDTGTIHDIYGAWAPRQLPANMQVSRRLYPQVAHVQFDAPR